MCAGVIEKNINGRIVFKLLTVDSYQVVYSEFFLLMVSSCAVWRLAVWRSLYPVNIVNVLLGTLCKIRALRENISSAE